MKNKRYYTAYKLHNGKYAIALYDPCRNQYYRSMTAEESHVTGAHTYCSGDPNDLGGRYTEFSTMQEAERYANMRNKSIDIPEDV